MTVQVLCVYLCKFISIQFMPKRQVQFCLLSLYWIDRMLAFNIPLLLLVDV